MMVSINLGITALAIYSIGSYQVPILGIIRSSVGDVIFPEMSERNIKSRESGLELWRKVNILYCSMSFPLFCIFFFHARDFIELLFTNQYTQAVPIFRIYLVLMIRQCFEMSSPLRSINKNNYFILSHGLAMAVNISLLAVLFSLMGITGPAVAYVISDCVMMLYLSLKILKCYKIGLNKLLYWDKLLKIFITSLIALPVLFLSPMMHIAPIFKMGITASLYLSVYVYIIKYMDIEEVNRLTTQILQKLHLTSNA
jgi:O-antigen/teichoic acid export membrane protein